MIGTLFSSGNNNVDVRAGARDKRPVACERVVNDCWADTGISRESNLGIVGSTGFQEYARGIDHKRRGEPAVIA